MLYGLFNSSTVTLIASTKKRGHEISGLGFSFVGQRKYEIVPLTTTSNRPENPPKAVLTNNRSRRDSFVEMK